MIVLPPSFGYLNSDMKNINEGNKSYTLIYKWHSQKEEVNMCWEIHILVLYVSNYKLFV